MFEITPKPHQDERGFFMRTYDWNLFREACIPMRWVQENHARSERKNIIRGLHFQFPPFSETKLVRCVTGAIKDVFVDLRKGSSTFGQWDSIELSADNKKMILIPRGFAHGYQTLTTVTDVLYKVDNFYSPEHEGGILWNDTELNIDWDLEAGHIPCLSAKDTGNMKFVEFIERYKSIDNQE